MCGISGFCDFTKKSNKHTLSAMTDVLHHRGPDDSGYSFYINETSNIGLGHRRLSILDLSSHGHQPMSYNELEIVYNGEVYNFEEIRNELIDYNYNFESDSDTEVVLKAYHKWGIKAVDKFIGMFAMAIYDKAKQKLILIRDRAGVKPLYYYYKNGIFMFASELKSFHENSQFEKYINTDALALYFQYGYILEPHSIFQNTYKLKAGHYLEFKIESKIIKLNKYWDVIDAYNKPKLKIDFEEAKSETKKLLKSAFEYRMVADVPVGMFLSGGYDSSAVTAILQKDRTEKLKTFSIGFHEEQYNEAHYAKEIAKYLGTDHTEYYCTQEDAQKLLPLMPEIWDEPFGDSSNLPTTLVSRLAKEQVSVSLSADGGDEIFGGYSKYTHSLKYQNYIDKIPFPNMLGSFANIINPKYLLGINKTTNFKSRFEKVKILLNSKSEIDIMNSTVYYFSPSETNTLINRVDKTINTAFDEISLLNSNNDSINKMMAIDYKTYQLDDILTKVDRATMSFGLEGREPFLDHRIIEYVATLPSNYKINNGEKKHLLKSIVHDYIPKSMMDRPKMGFSIPLNEWFGDELKTYILEYLQTEKVKNTGLFNVTEVEHLKVLWLKDPSIGTNKIWLLLTFMMWYEKWMK